MAQKDLCAIGDGLGLIWKQKDVSIWDFRKPYVPFL